MNILFALPLLGVVLSAPTLDERSPIVKRAMEEIMFGNQQNSNKQVKKSDPNVPLRNELPDVNAPVLPDVDGSVEASKAEDISVNKPDKESEVTEDELESFGKDDSSKDSEEETTNDSDVKLDESEEESKIAPEDAAAIEELEKNMDDGESKEDNNAVQSSNDNSLSDDSSYDTPYDIYQLYKQYQNMLSQDPSYYYNGYRRRRRAIQKRKFMGRLKERAYKRSHRNKRDLTYPDDSEYEPYYYPDLPYSDSDLYGLYENPYEAEGLAPSQVEPLEELLEENGEYETPFGQYDQPSWLYEYIPRGYEDVYKPVKRQSMLSFVPGNRKRSSYFYPVNEEPETHFGAFVPEKRDYFQTYGNLVRAARLLAAKQEEKDALQGYPEWYR